MSVTVTVLCGVVLAAGCGGSEATFTADSVSQAMTELVRENLAGKDITVDPLRCVQDGDQYHWRCIGTALEAGAIRYRVTIQVTCDKDSGECLSEPSTVVRIP